VTDHLPLPERAEPVDLLIEGGVVVTMNASRDVHARASVAVAQGRIVAVGPVAEIAASQRARRRIDASRRVVVPGLVNSVLVDGRVVVEAGRVTTIDEERLYAEVQQAAERLVARLGAAGRDTRRGWARPGAARPGRRRGAGGTDGPGGPAWTAGERVVQAQ
jgi:hypothetical protein